MCNPTLLQKLVDQLLTKMKISWAMYQRTYSVVKLAIFGDWLLEVGQAAGSVTMFNFVSSEVKKERSAKTWDNSQVTVVFDNFEYFLINLIMFTRIVNLFKEFLNFLETRSRAYICRDLRMKTKILYIVQGVY